MSQPTQHKLILIPAQGKALEVVDVQTTSPGDGEVLVKNHAVAINPVDAAIRDHGLFTESWPMVIGSDTAGEVVEVGSGVQNLNKGDRVLVATTYLMDKRKDTAGFQELTIAPEVAVTKIPDSLSYVDASVIPLSAATSSAGLFQSDALALDFPKLNATPNGKKVLIWGAATSVASSGIQLAVAAGYEVITTASQKNFEYAKKLGASKVFDYKSSSVVGDITAELQQGNYAGTYDAVGTRDTQLAIATIVAQLGGGIVATVLPPPEGELPANVTSKMVTAPLIFGPYKNVGQAVFQDYLPQALAAGKFVPSPKAEVVGHGLNAIQDAINKHSAGVSAQKIVVTL